MTTSPARLERALTSISFAPSKFQNNYFALKLENIILNMSVNEIIEENQSGALLESGVDVDGLEEILKEGSAFLSRTEIHGDQKNITVFGISGPWLVALVAVILAGVIGLVWVLVAQLGGDPDPVVVSIPTSSTPIVAPTDTPVPTPTTAPAALIQPTALPTPTVAPTITVVAQVLPPAPTEIPVPVSYTHLTLPPSDLV